MPTMCCILMKHCCLHSQTLLGFRKVLTDNGGGATVKKALLIMMLVGAMVFATAGTAFAAYNTSVTIPGTVAQGGTIPIDPTATKATGDLADGNEYYEVRVSGPGADTNVAFLVGWDPVNVQTTPGSAIRKNFNDYLAWTGNTGHTPAPVPTIKFNAAGAYTVDVILVRDTGAYPSNPILNTVSYPITVTAPPVVSTTASSPWSIGLLAVAVLGMSVFVARKKMASARD